MRIDSDRLKEILSDKTDLSPDEIDKQLKDLIDRIQKTSHKGKALEIKGFGLFYKDSDGELTFDPSEDFATEVNYKYAGMEPVELTSPGKAEESDLAGTTDTVTPGKEKPVDDSPKAPAGKKSKKTDPKTGTAASGNESDRIKKAASQKKKERDSVMTLIITVITIILLATILMLVMDRPGMETEETAMTDATEEPLDEQLPQEEEQDFGDIEEIGPESGVPEFNQGNLEPLDLTGLPGHDAMEEEPDGEPLADEDVEESEEYFGLWGESRDLDTTHYTIVLYALQSQARASETEEILQAEGYRTVISETSHDEHGQLWRVGVGQFESISDAQEAAGELPGNYQNNHLIGRIP